jgi:hypothetical protein
VGVSNKNATVASLPVIRRDGSSSFHAIACVSHITPSHEHVVYAEIVEVNNSIPFPRTRTLTSKTVAVTERPASSNRK